MNKLLLTLNLLLVITPLFAQENEKSTIITTDIDNFWTAYDKIGKSKDSLEQYQYLRTLFLDKGSPGLKAIGEARNYTAKSYLDAIRSYPLFWNSVRANTYKVKNLSKEIFSGIHQLKQLYPGLKPAKIYFTIGALRTGGTTLNDMVLIGSEIAMADKNTITSEFPKAFSNLVTHFQSNSTESTVLTNVHEYVHTQQKTNQADNLLAQCVMEGVAEYVSVKATGRKSTLPALSDPSLDQEKVKDRFSRQMFNWFSGYWLYSNEENEFNLRDLGYYIGYNICKKYDEKAADHQAAIKEMIELDYNNQTELYSFVDKSGYFSAPVQDLKARYEKERPRVSDIGPFKNKDQEVDPAITELKIEFSAPMNTKFRNFKYGSLGPEHTPKINKLISFSQDGRTATFEMKLKAGQSYQFIVGDGFRSQKQISLQPYLIEFKTRDK